VRISPLSALPLPLVVAWRYLRGRRSRLLQRTALAALASIALGVTAMVVAMALMTGYRGDLERKLIAGNAAVLAYPLSPGRGTPVAELVARLRRLPGVAQVNQVAYGQGTLLPPPGAPGAGEPGAGGPSGGEAVTLRGVGGQVDPMAGPTRRLGPGADGVPGTVLGSELARRIGARPGDRLRLVALGFATGRPSYRYQTVRVAGTYRTGFAEFDRSWMVLSRDLVTRLSGGGGSTLFEIGVDEPDDAPAVAAQVERVLGPEYLVTDWQRLNSELFSALRLQQLLLFFLLGLIVMVSTFNVASTLMVLVRERLRDAGVLAALGLDRRRLAAVFLAYGATLGLAGTLLGVALGAGLAWLLDTFELVRFDPEVAEIYFLSAVPFDVEADDVVAVVAFSLVFTFASCLLPALRVGRVRPSEALRYE
jgi:lipoprotein-releasing system permease protein